MTPIRVVIVDDDHLVRAGLRGLLSSDESIEVVDEASNGRSGIDRARHAHADIVLMDVRMPDLDGISATRELLAAAPETKVIILTVFEQDKYVYGAIKAGASGFLLKRISPEDLIAAIHTVADGDALLSPSVTRRVLEHVARQPLIGSTADPRLRELTGREREVLELIARGLDNQAIARELVVEMTTVKTHVRRIFKKLGVRDRVHAVIVAYETGLASPGPR